jgi:hypothetical protein
VPKYNKIQQSESESIDEYESNTNITSGFHNGADGDFSLVGFYTMLTIVTNVSE